MAKTPADTNGDTSGGSKLIDQVLIAHLSSTDRNSQELLRPDVQGLHGDPDRDAQVMLSLALTYLNFTRRSETLLRALCNFADVKRIVLNS